MSYIINSTNPFVSIKLTEKGREQLALGQLTFSYWGIGDSEINYEREELIDPLNITLSATSEILRPFDQEPNLQYYITPNGSLDPYQILDNSNKNVIKAIVNNQAIERGFFSLSGGVYTTLSSSTFTPYYESVSNSLINGTDTLTVTTTSAMTVGDIVLFKLANSNSGTIVSFENDRALPNLWFKIQSLSSTTITLDRLMPDYSSESGESQIIIYRGGEVYDTIASGNTTAYWDSGTLSFQSNNNVTCHDIPIWNMNNVWSENPAGITGLTTTNLYEDYTKFGSFPYLGFKYPYSGYINESDPEVVTSFCNNIGTSYDDDVIKSISIIHFTNNSISNLYGEYFYINNTDGKTVEVFMPDLMYHRRDFSTASGTTQGMRFLASGVTKTINNTDIQYIDLIEDGTLIPSSKTPLVVGRVYPQLKIIVIDNDEIVAALSYKSNRSWTLPKLTATLTSPSGSTGVLDVNETMYLSYILENNGNYGLQTTLPCQNYIKITNTTSSVKNIDFKLLETDLLPYMRKIEDGGYDGLGFHAYKFKLIYQIVSDSTIRPESGSWKVYDFTSTAITGVSGETINPKLLEIQNPSLLGFNLDDIKDSLATTFDITQSLRLAPNVSPEVLQFGDERFFYGNLNAYIGATIYKTIFDIRINSSLFNSTSNPTRSKDLSTNPPNIKVSEIGIYDTNKNLVCIGKLSTPVALITGNTIMLELSMDF